MATEQTPKQKIANKKMATYLGTGLVFMLLFNLLSLGGLYEIVLQPVGLHEWFKALQPNTYYEQLEQYRKYTDEEDRYMVMRYWNFVVGTIVGIVVGLMSIKYFLTGLKDTKLIVFLMAGLAMIILAVVVWLRPVLGVPPDGTNWTGMQWHYSGYLSIFWNALFSFWGSSFFLQILAGIRRRIKNG